MADLADRVASYGVSLHADADDTQLYLHLKLNEIASTKFSIASWTSATGYPVLRFGADTATASLLGVEITMSLISL